MHALDKWIKENALSRKIFANKLKISVASLSRYLAGNRIPKQSIMEKNMLQQFFVSKRGRENAKAGSEQGS